MNYKINESKLIEDLQSWHGDLWANQSDKAHASGLSQSTISRLESGRKKFSELKVSEYLKITKALNRAPFEYMERSQK